ncbi:hypothetical protein D3C87_2126290 [compost metagenome]
MGLEGEGAAVEGSLGEVEVVAGEGDDDRELAGGQGGVEFSRAVHQSIRVPVASKRWMALASGRTRMVVPG